MEKFDLFKKAKAIIDQNPKFKLEAYAFVLSGLEFTMKKMKQSRHVTGQELSLGLKEYALDQFGPMAKTVLQQWGITATLHFGEIVFLLIDAGLMRKTETDTLADFTNVYDFDSAFTVAYDL